MKRWLKFFLAALALVVLSLAAMVRPDIPLAELLPRYASGPSRFVDIDGRHVHYRDEGAGPVLLLLHGTSSSLHTWDGWVKELGSRHRIVRLDLPGFALTGPAPDGDHSPTRNARVVAKVLDHLGISQVDLAGNSLGGRVGLTFALTYPTRVRKLVLIDAAGLSGQETPPIFKLAKVPVLNAILRWVTPRFLVKKNLAQVYADDTRITDALVERYDDLTRREGNRAATIARFRGPSYPDLDARLKDIRAPTLILWGEHDAWIPLSFAQRFQHAIAGARLITYADAGHVPMEELPHETARDAEAFLAAP